MNVGKESAVSNICTSPSITLLIVAGELGAASKSSGGDLIKNIPLL